METLLDFPKGDFISQVTLQFSVQFSVVTMYGYVPLFPS
jgi:hypothetical protein